ncbi:MAG: two-component sensor histidine kinase, partial [Bradyrhizobium sp.]
MSGVIAALRRTLLSCTSLARGGRAILGAFVGASGLGLARPAHAADLSFLHTLVGMNHQEFAALTTALSLLGFSVVSAILLMRTRLRAARNEAGLRSDIQRLQSEADRYRSLLFAEPQVLIAWPAGEDRPQISGDVSSLTGQELPQRILAFGTWLPPAPALQMDRAIDTLRESGEGFLLNLTTSSGHAVEALGRAIGGQAVVRIR